MSVHLNHFSWPSLYSPAKEVGFYGPPVRPGGYYLSDLDAIFTFTLYWTLIFYLPLNFVAGLYAFLNLSFPPPRSAGAIALEHLVEFPKSHSRSQSHSSQPQSQSRAHAPPPPPVLDSDDWPKSPRANARRSRLTFSVLVFFAFLVFSLVRAVVGAAVMAFVLYGVYRAGEFYMSTWIPFVWAVIQSLIALLEIWPSIIDIV